MQDLLELLKVQAKDDCYHALCHACNGSGYDYFDDRQCDMCEGGGDIRICATDD